MVVAVQVSRASRPPVAKVSVAFTGSMSLKPRVRLPDALSASSAVTLSRSASESAVDDFQWKAPTSEHERPVQEVAAAAVANRAAS